MNRRYDVVFAADLRFPGGTSSAVAMDLRAALRAGRSAAVLPVRCPVPRSARPPNPRLLAEIEVNGVDVLDTDAEAFTPLLVAHHPRLFDHPPSRPVRLRADRVILVAQHPPALADGRPEYDPAHAIEILERTFAAEVLVAPVGPRVRELLLATGLRPDRLTPSDLYNLVDPADWDLPARVPFPEDTVVIGRHARPDPLKWPDEAAEILAAYPSRPDYEIRVLGGPPPPDRLALPPANWRISPFAHDEPQRFLAGLHFYVFFHSRRWIEAFGISIAEAMAARRVVILPHAFASLFRDGAVYCEPAEVESVVERLRADPAAYLRQAERGRAVAVERFSPAVWPERYAALTRGLPPPPPSLAPQPPRRAKRILFVSSNGVGLGHLTRQLAIAERLPGGFDAAFLTLSQGARLVAARGFPVDYVPSHQRRGLDNETWNRALAQEIALAVECHRPEAVVFDGNVPYMGLGDVAALKRDVAWVWIRRALWQAEQSAGLDRAPWFDLVIEPGELASVADTGPTVPLRDGALHVPPILLTDPDDRLSRGEAAARLEIDPDRLTVAVQLGSGSNFDTEDVRGRILAWLAANADAQVVEIRSPILATEPEPAPPGVVVRTVYPLHPLTAAIDLLVGNAGYNSFHESLYAGLPTVFVPNEAPEMDDQLLRARFAEVARLGLVLRAHAPLAVGPVLEEALSERFRDEVSRRARRLVPANGAALAARRIADLVGAVRTDRPLADALDRL